jgi:hypothetical protein
MWKDTAMVCSNALSQHLLERTWEQFQHFTKVPQQGRGASRSPTPIESEDETAPKSIIKQCRQLHST